MNLTAAYAAENHMQQMQSLNSFRNQQALMRHQMMESRCPCSHSGPSWNQHGYDQMYQPPGGFGFGSPMNFMMNMMQRLMSMMGMGQMFPPMGGQQMPPYDGGYSPYPQPQNFWGTDNGVGNQYFVPGGSASDIYAGRHSNNYQHNYGGHTIQGNHSGTGSYNSQVHRYGSAQQQIRTGNWSTNNQYFDGYGQQLADAGHRSVTRQTAGGYNSSQAAVSGNNSVINQQITSVGVNGEQHAKAGHNSTVLQNGGSTQFIRAGVGGTNVQKADPFTPSNQEIKAGAYSDNTQIGGLANDRQEITVRGNGTTSYQNGGAGNDLSIVNNESGSHRATFGDSEGRDVNVYNSHDGSSRINLTSRTSGNVMVVNAKGGNDTVDVRIANPKDHNEIRVNLDEGNDRAILRSMPANPDAPIVFDGGSGSNTFEFRPDREGPYTIMQGDQVLHSVGKGGPVINLNNFENVNLFTPDGKPIQYGQ